MTSLAASKPQKVNLNELPKALQTLVTEKKAQTFIGSLSTSQGVFILLFSHRFNEEHSLIVTGGDTARIMAKVHEILEIDGGPRHDS